MKLWRQLAAFTLGGGGVGGWDSHCPSAGRHHSLLTPHSSLLTTQHSSTPPLITHSSTSYILPTTPHSPLLTPHSSLPTPHSLPGWRHFISATRARAILIPIFTADLRPWWVWRRRWRWWQRWGWGRRWRWRARGRRDRRRLRRCDAGEAQHIASSWAAKREQRERVILEAVRRADSEQERGISAAVAADVKCHCLGRKRALQTDVHGQHLPIRGEMLCSVGLVWAEHN